MASGFAPADDLSRSDRLPPSQRALRIQENTMVDALIIDACRTPRGVGKTGKGALSGLHPQQLGATRNGSTGHRLQASAARGSIAGTPFAARAVMRV